MNKILYLFSFFLFLSACTQYETKYTYGGWQPGHIDQLIQQKNQLADEGAKVALISQRFLGTPYQGATLIGNLDTPETLVLNLAEVDCLTFLDYVETFRLAKEPSQLPDTLRRVRYQDGAVSYQTRHHFFSEWIAANDQIKCVSQEIGGDHTVNVRKTLNLRLDGGYFLPGIQPKKTTISYIPADKVSYVISRLKTGDYIGFYTPTEGLDVTHVGIVIKTADNQIFLRHASSKKTAKKVMDEDLLVYMAKQKGIIVARPKSR